MLKKGQYIKILLLIEIGNINVWYTKFESINKYINRIIDFINYSIKINEFFNIILIQIHFIISKFNIYSFLFYII